MVAAGKGVAAAPGLALPTSGQGLLVAAVDAAAGGAVVLGAVPVADGGDVGAAAGARAQARAACTTACLRTSR